MNMWLVYYYQDFSTEVVAVCASEELALEAANKRVTDYELEVKWETVTVGDNEVIYGQLTDHSDFVSDEMMIECREVKDV